MTISTEYFDDLYGDSEDPFGFINSWYETRKYALTTACLPHQRFNRGFEPGCSIGILTDMLAGRCSELISWDCSAEAVRLAEERNQENKNVRLECKSIPSEWPAGTFDLMVYSEVLYYLDESDLQLVLSQTAETLRDGGVLIATHWRHTRSDQLWIADNVHAEVGKIEQLSNIGSYHDRDFLADVFIKNVSRCDATELSVARMYGVR